MAEGTCGGGGGQANGTCGGGKCKAGGGNEKGKGGKKERVRRKAPPGMCKKCKEAPGVVLAGQGQLVCRLCHADFVETRFRTSAREAWLVEEGAHIAVAFKGTYASAVALKLLLDRRRMPGTERRGRAERGARNFDISVLHVDESCLSKAEGNGGNDCEAVIRVAERICAASDSGAGVGIHCVPLEKVLGEDVGPDEASQLQSIVAAVEDPTGREDLVLALRFRLLKNQANMLGCTKLVVCDTANRIVMDALAAIAKGKGYALAASSARESSIRQASTARSRGVAACNGDDDGDTEASEIITVRPLREVTSKDAALLARFWELHPVPSLPESYTSAEGTEAPTINGLTATFIDRMQHNASRTIPTIMRTLAKMEPAEADTEAASAAGLCILCGMPRGLGEGASVCEPCSRYSCTSETAGLFV